MIQPGSKSLRKIAVVGRGTAGSLAAASVTRLHPDSDHELHHIYDSRIPVIGVGEGSWPSLVQELRKLTDSAARDHPATFDGNPQVRRRLRGMGSAQSRLHALLHAAAGVLRLPPVRRGDGGIAATKAHAHSMSTRRCSTSPGWTAAR